MRWIVALLLAAAFGCRPGGGTVAVNLPTAEFQTAERLVTDCGAEVIRAQLDLLRAILANFDPDQDDAPRLVFTRFDGRAVHWTFRDIAGALTFTDKFGVPGAPFDPTELLTSTDRLPTFLAHITDGRCVIDYASVGGVGIGSLVTTIESGTAGTLTGSGTIDPSGCPATFVIPGSSTIALGQPFPAFFRLDLRFFMGRDRVDLVVVSGPTDDTVEVDAYVNDPALAGAHDRFRVNLVTGRVD